ncbi:MAG: TonB-dependent receptor, partial [Prolixibacteraceae bacterium]|nr:TonB-dependent receptor [Prolixibacteraceae bacterium]
VSDETGHYQMVNLPEGDYTIKASAVGYKSAEVKVTLKSKETVEVKFELEEDVMHLDELVVTADRGEQKRTQAPVIVNTISSDLFAVTQSVTLSEGLNFSPGLRLENNCQNCGFTQIRMNGMEGPYSQILINSRPVFSGLAGVYGLELIPANMIEKVEVVRGGGSALYGSNAIAGTINILLKDPVKNSYEIGFNYSALGVGVEQQKLSADYSVNFNTSIVSADLKTGLTVYGFTRDRGMFDANADGFSEISPMNNLTLGSRFFHRFGYRNKLSVDYFAIKEERAGGNKHDLPLHQRDVAEAVDHNLQTVSMAYEQYFRDYDLLTVFGAGQFLDRDSYYGANQSLSDYGNSVDRTYNVGAQYKANFSYASLITGLEHTGSYLTDMKLGYPDYENAVIEDNTIIEVPQVGNTLVSDQALLTSGAFAQYDVQLDKAKIAVGGRFDHYRVVDNAKPDAEAKTGNVFSPRLSLMYSIHSQLQARVSYSQGYRAPQIFDEDLHIETSGSRQVINVNAPDLKQETSHSTMLSLDYNGLIGPVFTGLLVEGFYTRLSNPFVNEIGTPDENGTVLYTRVNAEDGATVSGLNIELKLKPSRMISFNSGFTIQKSIYDQAQEFNEKRFFRTPDTYGFFAVDWEVTKKLKLSTTGNYTGKMLVPYFGPNTDPYLGELRNSDEFFDLGLKFRYNIKLNGATMQWYGGVKNLFNAYQNDFDKGIDRDPAYMYGPVAPRTFYIGVKIGNLVN